MGVLCVLALCTCVCAPRSVYLLCVLGYVLLGAITMLLVDSLYRRERGGGRERDGWTEGEREKEREGVCGCVTQTSGIWNMAFGNT